MTSDERKALEKQRAEARKFDPEKAAKTNAILQEFGFSKMHIARRAMARVTGTGWSLRRLRERVLRAGARIILSARRVTLALSSSAAPFWALLWPRITRMHWAGP